MRNVITSVLIVLATCGVATAQTASEHLLLQRTVATGGDVVVREDGEGNVRGKLIEVTGAMLELETRSGRRRFELSRVSRVSRPGDPIIDGVFRGMGTAMGWCVLTCDRSSTHVDGPAFIGYVATGGLLGGMIDKRVNGNRTLYQRRPQPTIHIGAGPRGGSVTILF